MVAGSNTAGQEWRENDVFQGQLSVPCLISLVYLLLCSIPVLPPWHVLKDPGHSAKSVGGRLQLNTHAPYIQKICGFG